MKLPDGFLMLTQMKNRLTINLVPTPFLMCKNCKYYEVKDHWGKWGETPVLAAPNCPTCTKWGDGCMTKPDGWCYLAEPKEEDNG